MLIEFNVKHYRSIKENQRLSMVAAKDLPHRESNCMPSGISGIPQLVRTTTLYGANASGKSNLISALAFMRSMVETSAISVREGQTFNISPFRFDLKMKDEPSELEVTFVDNGIRYRNQNPAS